MRPYSPIGATGSAGQTGNHPGVPHRHAGNDRVKTVLLVAAAFASVLVGLVAANALLKEDQQPGSTSQAPK